MKKILQSLVLFLWALVVSDTAFAQSNDGDVNGDQEVNIADVNAVIGTILGDYGDTTSADVNCDGEINIADVNRVIDIILDPAAIYGGHEWVDLGLPSGTLWATCNVGASSPEEYGDYFAWGETRPKGYTENYTYNWSTYKWCHGSGYSLTKYCTLSEYGSVDNMIELEYEDDAAFVNWGAKWRMPSWEQINELVELCSWYWTTRNGQEGLLVKGPNGNTLFLPAAGYRVDRSHYLADWSGYYWSRTVASTNPNFAGCMYFYAPNWFGGPGSRRYGYSVRAVRVP